MKKYFPRLAQSYVACTLMVIVSSAVGQNSSSVVESQPFTPGQTSSRATTSTGASGNSDALSLLLEQNRQLRTEVQALRGLVEEQGFEIRKMQRDSLSRYTNVDQRLSDLESAPASAPPSRQQSSLQSGGLNSERPVPVRSTQAANPAIRASGTPTLGSNPNRADSVSPPVRSTGRSLGRGNLQPTVLSEQQLYQMAYDSVINSDFQLSIAEFDQYLSTYPEGRFVTNAHYWKGQAYLYLSRFEEARDSYEIILSQYSDSPKLPDAMYGLGLAYQGLGNISQAKQTLNDIKRRFPNTGVANLADTRLLSLD
ncbi:MAG: tol-pal system protein YbgF [Pseudohongiellaceae bacterium]